MKARYRESHALRDTVLDYSDSQFSADELLKQIAQCLRDNQKIQMLTIENAILDEASADALCQAVLKHHSLKALSLQGLKICSHATCAAEEYFPEDLDRAVGHLCAMLRASNLNHIELLDVDFLDLTERKYEHFDMVDPSVMRDLLTQEKEPFYIKQILDSLKHNPHLLIAHFTAVDVDLTQTMEKLNEEIKKRQSAENINAVLQGTHASIETYLLPEMFKAFAMGVWFGSRMKKQK